MTSVENGISVPCSFEFPSCTAPCIGVMHCPSYKGHFIQTQLGDILHKPKVKVKVKNNNSLRGVIFQ